MISKAEVLRTLKEARKTQDTRNENKFVQKETGKSLIADDEITRLSGVATGAQVNIIESVSVNGTAQAITEKGVDIAVPTKVSDITNDSNFQTDTEVQNAINAKISSTYKAGGSKLFSELAALAVEANEGYVYNVTDAFTTTADFVEGANKKHPAGTNVAVVNAGTSETPEYKLDVMAGFVDLSGLVEKETGKGLSTNDYTDEEKAQLAALEANKNETVTTEEIAAIFAD